MCDKDKNWAGARACVPLPIRGRLTGFTDTIAPPLTAPRAALPVSGGLYAMLVLTGLVVTSDFAVVRTAYTARWPGNGFLYYRCGSSAVPLSLASLDFFLAF